MEDWQKAELQRHFPKLIEYTSCEHEFLALFASCKILSRPETQDILNRTDSRDKAGALYTLLMKRRNAYGVLLEALEATLQTGVLELLSKSMGGPLNYPALQFSSAPEGFSEFMEGEGGAAAARILVITSLECELTLRRLRETGLRDISVQLINNSSSGDPIIVQQARSSSRGFDLTVITHVTNVAGVLPEALRIPGKVVIITTESPSQVRKLIELSEFRSNPVQMKEEELTVLDLTYQARKQILNKPLSWLGAETTLSRLNWGLGSSKDLTLLRGKLLIELLLSNDSKTLPVVLLEKLRAPPDESTRILRVLRSRTRVSVDIFQSKEQDMIAVSGIPRDQLISLTYDWADTSLNQLRRSSTSERFICLDADWHYKALCKKAGGRPAHWLSVNEGKVEVVASRGSVKLIQRHVAPDYAQNEFSEENFIKLLQEKPTESVIIFGDPGMGKTTLLHQIWRKLTTTNERNDGGGRNIVIFLEMRKLGYGHRESREEQAELILNAMADAVTADPVAKEIIKHQIRNQAIRVELLLDGYDEVETKDLDLARNYLRVIKEDVLKQSGRIFVSTSPHLLLQVEEALLVMGYELLPFSTSDAVNCLVSLWRKDKHTTSLDENKLPVYAKNRVESLAHCIDRETHPLTRNPLYVKLIAELYSAEEAANNCGSRSSSPPENVQYLLGPASPTDLLQAFVDGRIGSFLSQTECSGSLLGIHQEVALREIFPSCCRQLPQVDPSQVEEVLPIGLLTSSGSTHKFLHRSIAKYFVAQYFVGQCDGSSEQRFEESFWRENLLNTRQAAVMPCDYLNCPEMDSKKFLNDDILEMMDCLLGKLGGEECEETLFQSPDLDAGFLPDALKATVHDDLYNIFRLLLQNLELSESKASKLFGKELLVIAVKRCTRDFLARIIKEYKNHHELPLLDIHLETSKPSSLLHAAVARGDYNVFECLLQKEGFKGLIRAAEPRFRNLIHACVSLSLYDSNWTVEEKKDIMMYLAKSNSCQVVAKDSEGNVPLLCEYVHPQLLQHMVEEANTLLGPDGLAARNTVGENVFHFAATYLRAKDYYACLLQPSLKLASARVALEAYTSSTRRDFGGGTPLHFIMYFYSSDCLKYDYLKAFADFDVHYFNTPNEKSLTVGHLAAMRGSGGIVLRELHKCKADLCQATNNGDSCLHLTSKWGDVEALKFLLQLGLSPTQQNNKGDTVLHVLLRECQSRSRNLVDAFKVVVDGLSADCLQLVNNKKESILHVAAQYGNVDMVKFVLRAYPLARPAELPKDISGLTPLFNAVQNIGHGKLEPKRILQTFVDRLGLDVTHCYQQVDSRDQNLLHYAVKFSFPDTLEFLLSKTGTAELNGRDADGNTPLHYALLNTTARQRDKVVILVSAGAAIRVKNARGLSPLAFALKENQGPISEETEAALYSQELL